jgi:hypothetical protein
VYLILQKDAFEAIFLLSGCVFLLMYCKRHVFEMFCFRADQPDCTEQLKHLKTFPRVACSSIACSRAEIHSLDSPNIHFWPLASPQQDFGPHASNIKFGEHAKWSRRLNPRIVNEDATFATWSLTTCRQLSPIPGISRRLEECSWCIWRAPFELCLSYFQLVARGSLKR